MTIGNYKPYGHDYIQIGSNYQNVTIDLDSSKRIVKILWFDFDLSVAEKTLHETITGANYQVPSTKTYYPVSIRVFHQATTGVIDIGTSVSIDTGISGIPHNIRDAKSVSDYPLNFPIAGNAYMNVKTNTANVYYVQVIGYEELD